MYRRWLNLKLTLKYLRNNIDGLYSITTKKVAEELCISREHYSRFENGHLKLDDFKIKKLSVLFKVNKNTIIKAWENSRGGNDYVRDITNWATTFSRGKKTKVKDRS